MAKRDKASEIAIDNLKGFSLTGAEFQSTMNVPTGYFALDFVIHYGYDPSRVDLTTLEGYKPGESLGLPLGKLVEIFGEEGSGKSSLAYRAVGYAQKMGLTCAWLDAEHSFSEDLARINGCNSDDIIYPNEVYYAEDFMDLILGLCETDKIKMVRKNKPVEVNGPKIIVLDSIASLIPKAKAEALSEQQFMGLVPRLLSSNLGKIAACAEKNGVLVILINQLREKIGVLYGNPEKSPGGRALKHFCSLRLKLTKKNSKDAKIFREDEESGKEVLIGGYSSVRLEKNRFAKPFLESLFIPIYYEPYFPDIEETAFDAGRQVKLITVRKGTYSWNDIKMEGRKKFIDHIMENELLDDLIKSIKTKAEEESILLPPELVQYEIGKKDEVRRKISGDRQTKDSTGSKSEPKKKRGKKSP